MNDTWTDDDDEMLAAESKTLASAMLRLNLAFGACAREIKKAWREGARQYRERKGDASS